MGIRQNILNDVPGYIRYMRESHAQTIPQGDWYRYLDRIKGKDEQDIRAHEENLNFFSAAHNSLPVLLNELERLLAVEQSARILAAGHEREPYYEAEWARLDAALKAVESESRKESEA